MFLRVFVVVFNDNIKLYRVEIEILLTDIENDSERNLVGHIANDDMMILDEMEKHPEHIFGFIE